jgi:hypothetical protein
MPLREFPAPKEAAERIAVAHARAVDVTELEIPIDGSVDVTRQLQAAWREYGLIKLPAGTYEVSAMLEGPPLQGAGIIGSGSGSTLVVSSNLTDDVIRSSDKVFAPIFSGLAISRSALATTGYGLNMNPTSTNDWALVRDLWLWNHAIGINLGSTGYSVAQQIRSEANRFHGFTIVGQWQLFDLVALVNGGNGFHVQAPHPASLGQWRDLASYGNAGFGLLVLATSNATRMEALRVSDSFFGGDAAGEIYLDTYATAAHTFTNVYCELQGDGRHGITITENNPDCLFNGCHAQGMGAGRALSWDGAGTLFVKGGSYITTGMGTGIAATRGKASIIGAKARSATGTAIACVAPMAAASIIGCDAGSSILNQAAVAYSQGNF